MAQVNPYLIFNGTCEAAFNHYKSVFGGEFPYIGRFGEMPPGPEDENCPPPSEEDKNRIMHVSLMIGNTVLMGSDTTSDRPVTTGDNFSVSINTDSREEADKMFNGLSAGGNVIMPMENTFWGAYFGMFTDKFGVNWMVNFDEKPQM